MSIFSILYLRNFQVDFYMIFLFKLLNNVVIYEMRQLIRFIPQGAVDNDLGQDCLADQEALLFRKPTL